MAPVIAVSLDGLLESIGYPAVFGMVGGESLGIPLPGETMLITAGLYAGTTHRLSIVGVLLAAMAGAIIGDNIGYLVGYKGGLPFLRRYGRYIRLTEQRLQLARYLFAKYGGRVVFFGRFVSILRTYAAFFAGTSRMAWRRFFLFNAAGGITWALIFGLAAYFGGNAFKRLSTPLDIALVALAIVAIAFFIRFVRGHTARLNAEAQHAFADGQDPG